MGHVSVQGIRPVWPIALRICHPCIRFTVLPLYPVRTPHWAAPDREARLRAVARRRRHASAHRRRAAAARRAGADARTRTRADQDAGVAWMVRRVTDVPLAKAGA